MDGLNDLEVIVGRIVRSIVAIARKVARFATLLLVVCTAVCVGSFLLGLAALEGGIRNVWIVLGIVFGSVAIGAALVGRWGVGRIRKDVPAIAGEVRAIIAEGREQSTLLIRRFGDERDDVEGASGSAIVVSRGGFGLGDVAGHGIEGAGRLTAALHAVTRYPLLALLAIAITLVFGFLVPIFLLALAL